MMGDSLKGNFACNLTYWLIGLVSVALMVIYSMRIKAEQEERKKLKVFMDFSGYCILSVYHFPVSRRGSF